MMVDNEIKFYMPPEPVGWWVLPGASLTYYVRFAAYTKPNWLCRFAMRHVFDWKYEEVL